MKVSEMAPGQVIYLAMRDPDRLVARIVYEDRNGKRTERTVSPIRFLGKGSFLALCIGREDVRRFNLSQVETAELQQASDVLMGEEYVVEV